jgi:hypothetical protein
MKVLSLTRQMSDIIIQVARSHVVKVIISKFGTMNWTLIFPKSEEDQEL